MSSLRLGIIHLEYFFSLAQHKNIFIVTRFLHIDGNIGKNFSFDLNVVHKNKSKYGIKECEGKKYIFTLMLAIFGIPNYVVCLISKKHDMKSE